MKTARVEEYTALLTKLNGVLANTIDQLQHEATLLENMLAKSRKSFSSSISKATTL
ncbi:hypothetical protein [Cesiribacter sp. SM1]|uniref:hypothetical protein n=1 Tax=Cesiribacter sp. SM1 TaxID=2861196 RepID=UPI001CD7A1A9|nr:hypothetical protein [Cesiribacter sp. SM1]